MFQFYWPWLALLFPLPLLIWWLPRNIIEKPQGSHILFPALYRLKNTSFLLTKKTIKNELLFFSTLLICWILLIFALMQPEKVDQFKQVKNQGYDLMLAVDISGSMQALDFSTNTKAISRLDATKNVVSKFVLGRRGDRIGLITFGERAYLHVPLTLDTVAVSRMLGDTVTGMAGNGTAIGDAIGLSVRTLRDRPVGSRVLVLLTDGEDNASSIPPLEAAKLAKQYGVKIYTIGVGKKGPVPFPNGFGGYGMAEINVDEDLLKEIAQTTGGKYFQAQDQNVLESIYARINELEKTEANETIFLVREPLYYYPLTLAMSILLILSLYQLFDRRIFSGS